MKTTRRTFVNRLSAIAGGVTLGAYFNPLMAEEIEFASQKIAGLSPSDVAMNEDYWATIQQAYSVSPSIINLNNGGVAPQPIIVQEALDKYNRMCNDAPSYFMWQVLDSGREPLRQNLADLGGCSAEEIAINRNSTEGLETVIFGLPLKAGDEVVLTKQDYPNMLNAWKQREKRDGIKLVFLDFQFPIEDEDQIVKTFVNAFTDKTKIVHITHIINWVGQILPAKKIARAAKARGIEVVIDGAHSFAHLDYNIPDLEGDYFATSLHKWLSAPFGSGLLYIRKEKISKIWPLFANDKPDSDNIRKFESLGTRSFPIEQSIGYSLNFHNSIGSGRKEARLRYLKNYWAEKALQIPKVKIHTSLKENFSCAICGVSIDGMTASELDVALFTKYKIHAVGINWENIHCVRITPNVYTKLKDLDKLVRALGEIATSAKS